MIDWKRKLLSRKFWVAVAEFVTMLLMAFHADEGTATEVAALIMAGAGVIAYIIGEGLADAGNGTQTVMHFDGDIETEIEVADDE